MTPREVIPAEISEEVEAEVSTALNKMVADERRFSIPDPRIEKLKAALREIASISKIICKSEDMPTALLLTLTSHRKIALKALEDDDALLL